MRPLNNDTFLCDKYKDCRKTIRTQQGKTQSKSYKPHSDHFFTQMTSIFDGVKLAASDYWEGIMASKIGYQNVAISEKRSIITVYYVNDRPFWRQPGMRKVIFQTPL